MQVLSAAEMQACDRATTERFGVASIDLMRAAAAAVAAFAREQFPRARRVTVLCGRGNNGGDGMMAARLLADAGLEVTTLLLGEPEGLKGDAAEAWAELTNPERGQDSRGDDGGGTGAAEGRARYRPDCGCGGGDGIQAAAEGAGAGGAEVDEGEQGAGAVGRFAFGLGGGCDGGRPGCAGISCRCGDHIYRAQAGACVWTTDAAVGSAGGGGADRVAGGGDCFGAEAALGGVGACALAQTPRAAGSRTRATSGTCWWWAERSDRRAARRARRR